MKDWNAYWVWGGPHHVPRNTWHAERHTGDSHSQGRPHTPCPSPDTACTLERLPTRQVDHKNDRNNENTHMYLSLDRPNRLLYLPLIFCTPSCGNSDTRVKALGRILRVPNRRHRNRRSGRGPLTRRPGVEVSIDRGSETEAT